MSLLRSKLHEGERVDQEMGKPDRITVNSNVCPGQPTIRGMRITVSIILKRLARGESIQEPLEAYPELEAEDVQQAIEEVGEHCP